MAFTSITRTVLCVLTFASCAAAEKFIPPSSGVSCELKAEATVVGNEVRFRQIARWSDADKAQLDPIGDLIVARLGEGQKLQAIHVRDLRMLLRDAGVNASTINFAGPLTCTITRSDAAVAAQDVVEQHAAIAADEPVFVEPESDVVEPGRRTLREALTQALATRLNLPIEALQINFREQDDRFLRLSEPQFRFSIDSHRGPELGDISWSVTVTSDAGREKVFIPATARAWQEQIVVSRPLSTRQIITEGDLVQRRTLVDRLADDALLKSEQAVGQAAARELKPGTVLTGRLIDAAQLIKPGQLITIQHGAGAVQVTIVARALDGGAYGQTIRVRNEMTKQIMRVTVVGPQQAALTAPELES